MSLRIIPFSSFSQFLSCDIRVYMYFEFVLFSRRVSLLLYMRLLRCWLLYLAALATSSKNTYLLISIYLSVCLSVCPSVVRPSVRPSVRPPSAAARPPAHPPACLSIYLSIYLYKMSRLWRRKCRNTTIPVLSYFVFCNSGVCCGTGNRGSEVK